MFKAGASRIADHLFGQGGMAACTMALADAAFRSLKLKVQEKLATNAQAKQRKAAIAQVNAAAGSSAAGTTVVVGGSAAAKGTDQPAIAALTVSSDVQLYIFLLHNSVIL